MHLIKDLSNKIDQLFFLRKEDFDPKVHFLLAEEIVKTVNPSEGRLMNLTDIFRFRSNNKRIESEDLGGGEYIIEQKGRLYGCEYLGVHPKLVIYHWKEKTFHNIEKPKVILDIAYQGNNVTGIMRAVMEPRTLRLGKLSLALSFPEIEWIYKNL